MNPTQKTNDDVMQLDASDEATDAAPPATDASRGTRCQRISAEGWGLTRAEPLDFLHECAGQPTSRSAPSQLFLRSTPGCFRLPTSAPLPERMPGMAPWALTGNR
jgi:hypothetical protein